MFKKNIVIVALVYLLWTLFLVSGWSAGDFPMPPICDRVCWAARDPQCTMSQEPTINRAVIHHTEVATDYETTSLEFSAARVRAHQNYHMDSLAWCDIGYHFLVDKLGNRFEGREGSISSRTRGAHDGVNTCSMGFSCMGDFRRKNEPSVEMRQALYDLIAWKVEDPFNGFGAGTYNSKTCGFLCVHWDAVSTTCPGDNLFAYIESDVYGGEARTEVNYRITGGSTPTPTPTPGPTPLAPSNLDAVAVSTTQVDLTWDDNSDNEDNFILERKKSIASSYDVVETLDPDTISYSDTGVRKGTTYNYRIKAVNTWGESDYSNVATVTTPKK